MKSSITLSILCLLALGLNAQSEKKKRRLVLNEVGINQGRYSITSSRKSLDLKEYFISSPEALTVINNNYELRRGDFSFQLGYQANLQLGFRFRKSNSNEINDRLSLRIGLLYQESYSSFSNFSRFFNYTSTSPVFIDSETFGIKETYNNNYLSVNGNSEGVLIQSAIQIYTKPSNHIQFYTGIGIGLGLAYNNSIRIIEVNQVYSNTSIFNSGENFPISSVNETIVDEVIIHTSRLDNFFTTQFFLPFGTRLRLGTTNKFWSRMYLGTELWTTFALDYTKEFGTKGRFGMLSNFSLSYQFGQ